jgi:nitrogen-specific signal transduction histidine kinase
MNDFFAPPQRASVETVLAQNRELAAQSTFARLVDTLPDLVMVVNRERQVVYASTALEALTHATGVQGAPGAPGALLGQRPGEVLGCTHAGEAVDGCGASPPCELCGAARAIAETQASGRPASQECRLTVRQHGREVALNYSVSAAPFSLGSDDFVLVSFRDISQEKRKASLERIFFHDLLNTASSLKVYLDLLRRSASDASPVPFVSELEAIADSLVEEIQSQKMLVSAENGTLTAQRNLIVSRQIVEDTISLFARDEIARDKEIAIAPFSEAFGFVADAAVLRRVLANALKNALEASPGGATVTVGFRRQGEASALFWVNNPGEIPSEVQLQLFHRYFSTKGENRGLGTYSMKLLTEGYLKGSVSFESSPEKGTTFGITVPLQAPGDQSGQLKPGDLGAPQG